MTTIRRALAALILSSAIVPTSFAGPSLPPTDHLPLQSFLEQVKAQHEGITSARLQIEAIHLYGDESHLVVRPQMFANLQYSDDQKPNPQTKAFKTIASTYQFGVSELTPYGVSGKLYYSYELLEFQGGFLANKTYTARPIAEVSASLWRNLMGNETRTSIAAADAANLAKGYQQSFTQKAILSEAEAAYWNLALARESVVVLQDALARSLKLADWNGRRAKLGLGDRADFLQATAAVEARKLDLKIGEDEVRSAARHFNSSRGVNSDVIAEILDPISPEILHHVVIPERAEKRDDVKAAAQQTIALRAQAEVAREHNLPTLEVYGQYAFNGSDKEGQQAISDSWKGNLPTAAIGLRFSSSLDAQTTLNDRQGWSKEASSADYVYQRKLFEQERDWQDLVARFQNSQNRLSQVEVLVKTQKTKLDYERDRHSRGRSTTQQILLFEIDYQQAQLALIRNLAEILQIHAQMKLFGANNESR